MSDAKDALVEARAKLRQLAARALARKEALEEELARFEAKKKTLAADLRTIDSAGRDDLRAEASTIGGEIDARIDALATGIAAAEQQRREALDELSETERSGRDLERLELRAAIDAGGDPHAPSPVERALENVRSHIADLEARAELERDLAGPETRDRARIDRELSELEARAQLEALKAKKKPRAPEPTEEPKDDSETPAGRPKRTM